MESLFTFRVWACFDEKYKTWIARCLETGSVATADDANTAKEMITELLQDELSFNIGHNNLGNLFASPATFIYWWQWIDSKKDVETITFEFPWQLREYVAAILIKTEVPA